MLLDELKINFTKHISQEARELYVLINPSSMQRVLSNIINNAIDAIVAIKCRSSCGAVDVTFEKRGTEFVVIVISDNGCGMPPELVEKIGKGECTVGKKEGHGIGLYYAIHHIKAWQGTYSIETKLDVGTRFLIVLPIVKNKASI
jgi:signal transduction histidine kinase